MARPMQNLPAQNNCNGRINMKILSLVFPLFLLVLPLSTQAETMPPDELIKVTVRDVLDIINKDKRVNDANTKRILLMPKYCPTLILNV